MGSNVVGMASAKFNTEFGSYELHAYEFEDGSEHLALRAQPSNDGPTAPLVRLQSACITATAFHALLCDCRQQLEESLRLVASEGGLIVYLDQEGRGHGTVEKVAQLREIAAGANTYEAALRRDVEPDVRTFDQAVTIVHDQFGSAPVRLLTNNPEKIDRVRAAGLEVAERVAIEPDPTATNRDYLSVKKAFMGHLLTKV